MQITSRMNNNNNTYRERYTASTTIHMRDYKFVLQTAVFRGFPLHMHAVVDAEAIQMWLKPFLDHPIECTQKKSYSERCAK